MVGDRQLNGKFVLTSLLRQINTIYYQLHVPLVPTPALQPSSPSPLESPTSSSTSSSRRVRSLTAKLQKQYQHIRKRRSNGTRNYKGHGTCKPKSISIIPGGILVSQMNLFAKLLLTIIYSRIHLS